MIGGRAPARERADRCAGAGHRAALVAPRPLALTSHQGPRPHPLLLQQQQQRRRRRDLVATAWTPSSSSSSSSSANERPRPLAPTTRATAATEAPPSSSSGGDNDPNNLVINADAIPPTAALRVAGVLSPIHPPPGPWAPPLLNEADHAPDEFLKVTTLRPGPIWYPAWMRYRRRDGNDIFWSDKLSRNTMDVPLFERRWTVLSTVWYLLNWWRFRGFPPTFRYLIASAYRAVAWRLYEGHKRLVLWQCKLEAALGARAVERRRRQQQEQQEAEAAGAAGGAAGGAGGSSSTGSSSTDNSTTTTSTNFPYGPRPNASFSRLMALRRLHWRNSPMAELLYLQNVALTGRVHQLPPRMLRRSPPTLFWLF